MNDIAAHIARLYARAAQLEREVAGARADAGPTRAEVSDRKEEAGVAMAGVVHDAELERDLRELRDVKAALERVADGTYGTCTRCGEPISAERLQAVPSAACCRSCQTALETHR